MPRCESCQERAADYVIDVQTEDGSGGAVHMVKVCELCDTEDALTRRLVQLNDFPPSRG
jgi:hypothetical protein